jgi:hypothetical protein
VNEDELTFLNNDPSRWQLAILHGLQFKPCFHGLDPAMATRLAKRRAKNKVAKASRKRNR